MTFKEEIYNHYTTANGAIHTMRDPDQQVTSGNHLVINATFHRLQEKIGLFTPSDVDLAKQFIDICKDNTGTYNRAPGKEAQDQSHDDLIAIGVSSVILGLPYAKELYDYGNKWRFPKLFGVIPIPTKWYIDNTEESPNFNFKHCHWRFGWVVACYKKAAGVKLNWFDKLAYKLYLKSGTNTEDPTGVSGRILRWLTIRVMQDEESFKEEIKLFYDSLQQMYATNFISEMLAMYHRDTHPFFSMTRGVNLK